ncbi:MAG: heavy-metal-associated domain-containing protein [Nitrospirae bacterium]|nr:heavy-metal-associated domain-containing protein [Nitrospirota bacterium]MBF0592036.1 heavy-metal-associated domain-containing protein [Nitrospirota bacterium]
MCNMPQIMVNIEGMSCTHCVARVKKAIESLPSVLFTDVDVGCATITYADATRFSRDKVVRAIEDAGYRVK